MQFTTHINPPKMNQYDDRPETVEVYADTDVIIGIKATIYADVKLMQGCRITNGSAVKAMTKIERNVIVNRAEVGESCRIGADSVLKPGSRIGNHVTLGTKCIIGHGAHVVSHVTLHDHTVVADGKYVGIDDPCVAKYTPPVTTAPLERASTLA